MNIDELYTQIIEDLKQDKRAFREHPKDHLSQLKGHFDLALNEYLKDPKENQKESLKKIICILEYSFSLSKEFDDLLIMGLEKVKDSELIIYLLSLYMKHTINRKMKDGERPNENNLTPFKTLLNNTDPEVCEWALRSIEQLGSSSIRLRDDILKVRPSIFSTLNKHKKASRQIIELLEKRWEMILPKN